MRHSIYFSPILSILYGIEFKNGVGYSNNDYVVSVLKESGYVVEESKPDKKKETEDVH